jgi:hypothetical protein
LQIELVNIETRELANEADKGKAGSFRGSFQKQNITNGGCKGPKVLERSLNIRTVQIYAENQLILGMPDV